MRKKWAVRKRRRPLVSVPIREMLSIPASPFRRISNRGRSARNAAPVKSSWHRAAPEFNLVLQIDVFYWKNLSRFTVDVTILQVLHCRSHELYARRNYTQISLSTITWPSILPQTKRCEMRILWDFKINVLSVKNVGLNKSVWLTFVNWGAVKDFSCWTKFVIHNRIIVDGFTNFGIGIEIFINLPFNLIKLKMVRFLAWHFRNIGIVATMQLTFVAQTNDAVTSFAISFIRFFVSWITEST